MVVKGDHPIAASNATLESVPKSLNAVCVPEVTTPIWQGVNCYLMCHPHLGPSKGLICKPPIRHNMAASCDVSLNPLPEYRRRAVRFHDRDSEVMRRVVLYCPHDPQLSLLKGQIWPVLVPQVAHEALINLEPSSDRYSPDCVLMRAYLRSHGLQVVLHLGQAKICVSERILIVLEQAQGKGSIETFFKRHHRHIQKLLQR